MLYAFRLLIGKQVYTRFQEFSGDLQMELSILDLIGAGYLDLKIDQNTMGGLHAALEKSGCEVRSARCNVRRRLGRLRTIYENP